MGEESKNLHSHSSFAEDDEYYQEGPGLVYIFSQDGGRQDGYDGGDPRTGNSADVRTIQETFTGLGHTVEHSGNFEGFEVKDFYENIKQMLKETEYYSLTLFLLGHGGPDENGQDCLADVDGELMNIRDTFIRPAMHSQLPSNFRGRPRLVFIQACRGQSLHELVGAVDCPKGREAGGMGEGGTRRPPPPPPPPVADGADFFIMRGPGDHGSFFVQAFCKSIRENSHYNMDSHRKEAQKGMAAAAREHRVHCDHSALVPEATSTLSKDFRYKSPPPPAREREELERRLEELASLEELEEAEQMSLQMAEEVEEERRRREEEERAWDLHWEEQQHELEEEDPVWAAEAEEYYMRAYPD